MQWLNHSTKQIYYKEKKMNKKVKKTTLNVHFVDSCAVHRKSQQIDKRSKILDE